MTRFDFRDTWPIFQNKLQLVTMTLQISVTQWPSG